MSTDLDPIASIVISAGGSPLTREGFGVLAVILAQAASARSIESFASLPEVVSAGYVSGTPKHRIATAAFSQNPRPKKLKIINTTLALATSETLTCETAVVGSITAVKVRRPDGTTATYSYTAIVADTTTLVAAGLVALVNAGETGDPASNSGAVITFANVTDGQLFFYEPVTNLGTYKNNTADPGYGAELDAALLADSDFYGVTGDCGSQACVAAIAAWALTNKKLAVVTNSDAIELTASGATGVALVTAANTRAGGLWHHAPWEFANVAWLAARLLDPERGRKTWAYATLEGITPSTLNTTQRGYLEGDRWNFYVTLAARNVVIGQASSLPGGGYTFGGTWIDEVHGDDWIAARCQEDIAQHIIDAGILIYDQAGIDSIRGVLRSRLEQAAKLKMLLEGSVVVNDLDLADVSTEDRGARTLNGITAAAKRASAIHRVVDVDIGLSY
jgi:hypothetical protein